MDPDEELMSKWHQDEEDWWDECGEYMTYQWKLTPALNEILRSELEADYINFLLHPDENLLDLGCGSGWLSVYFAERGMDVLGIDVSQGQINAANQFKSDKLKGNLEFECCDLIHWDCEKHSGKFCNVFVNAFLHHLPEAELEMVIRKISASLKPGGRVYMYEPLKVPSKKNLIVGLIDLFNRILLKLLLNVVPNWFGQFTDRHKAQLELGYRMCSPHEGPVDVESIKRFCAGSFEIVEMKGWHLNSLGFAMHLMGFKDGLRNAYRCVVEFLYWQDKVLFKVFGWQAFSQPQKFILCSIKLIKIQ